MALLTRIPVILGTKPPAKGKSYYGSLVVHNGCSFGLETIQTSLILKARCIFKITPSMSIHRISTDQEYFVVWIKIQDFQSK